jgi:hypothetical protein
VKCRVIILEWLIDSPIQIVDGGAQGGDISGLSSGGQVTEVRGKLGIGVVVNTVFLKDSVFSVNIFFFIQTISSSWNSHCSLSLSRSLLFFSPPPWNDFLVTSKTTNRRRAISYLNKI